jgi:hypothetical protein
MAPGVDAVVELDGKEQLVEKVLFLALIGGVEPLGDDLVLGVREVNPLWIRQDVDETVNLRRNAVVRGSA